MNPITYTFIQDEDLLEDVQLEDDGDIDEYWLEKKTRYLTNRENEPRGITVVYMDMSREEWKEILPEDRWDLWGQSRVVNGKVICYGSWHEESQYDQSKNFDEPTRSLNELTIGILHEIRHGLAGLFNEVPDLTHYFFYGYDEKTDEDRDRYERTPDAVKAYEEILADGVPINLICIRTQEITWQFKREVKAIERVINPMPKLDNITRRHLTPLSDHSWSHNRPQSIIFHTLLGGIEGSYSWLDKVELSYNYMIDEDGTIYEQIPYNRSAWHAGIMDNPTKRVKDFFVANPNVDSVGVAFARNGEKQLTEAQTKAAIELIGYLEDETGIEYAPENMFSHNEISSYKPEEVLDYKHQIIKRMEGEQINESRIVPPESLPWEKLKSKLRWLQANLSLFR